MLKSNYGLFATIFTAILLLFIWFCFTPGFMSYDSMVQYRMSLDQHYADSHPVIMSYVWHLLGFAISGPQSLLILHLCILSAGIFFWYRNFRSGMLSLLVPGIFFLPWIINFSGVLWKDVSMAFSLFLATALLFNRKKSRLTASLSLPFIFYATAVRHNAILAIFPIILFALKYYWPSRSLAVSMAISALFMSSLLLGSSLLSYNILHAEKKHFETFLMGDDIAKISSLSGENLMPWVKQEDIRFCTTAPILYERALCFIQRGYDSSGSLVVDVPFTTTHTLWKKTVLSHPTLYLRARSDAFFYFIRSPRLKPYYVWHSGIMQNEFNIQLAYPRLANVMRKYVAVSKLPLLSEFFKPYLWGGLSLLLMLMSMKIRPSIERMQVQALNASSLGYFLSYAISVPSADFRYIYWCIIATSLSIVIFAASTCRETSQAATGSASETQTSELNSGLNGLVYEEL